MKPTCSCCSSYKEESHNDLTKHWDKAYSKNINKLGWYEENPKPSLDLIKKCKIAKNARILNIGVGTSTLIDKLLKEKFENIIANDLSSAALHKLKERLGSESKKVNWIVDDLTNPTNLLDIEQVDLWHDRAVLHFFNEKEDQESYFNLVKKLVKKNGQVIIATYNLNGATKCNGLYVFRYNKEMLQKRMGSDFELTESFDYTYKNPFNDTREYIYTLFKRIN
ncbi:MAG: class I SAM-dependent methyltransferase [Bacteroidales bacterium]|nr:class I SAM-dependent methyltransferase [Bacteroidales bacterium]